MPGGKPDILDPSRLRQMALSRWENEGGAGPDRPQVRVATDEVQCEIPQLTLTDLAQLRIRVIALENLVITLLAEASDSQIELVRRNGSLHLTKAGTVDLGIIAAALVRLACREGARADRFITGIL